MRKFISKYWEILLVIFLSLTTAWPLFVPGYFSHHDDLHVMRIFEMRKCFADFQIPCRWVPDMGYGNGYPLFNFYGVFPYYVGGVASFVLGYIGAAKLLFFLPIIFGGTGMYLLTRELFGKIPALIASALYIFAPYRALDLYVRGAIGESFALSIIPFVFYFFLRLIRSGERKFFIGSTLTSVFFLTSHNIMTLIFTPILIGWIMFWLFWEKSKYIKPVVASFLLALGISAFFIGPAFFEKNLVQTEALTRAELDFRAQFVKVSQLFIDRSWNYGGSQPESDDTISYQIGWPHWWIVVLSIFIVVLSKKRKNLILLTLLFLIFTFGVYMTHNKSAPVWESFKILSFVQFPWRFLSIVIFSSSLIAGVLFEKIRGRRLVIFGASVIFLTIILNWRYFRPEHFYTNLTDQEKLSGQNFIDQQKGALLDYLPKTALEPRELPPKTPYVIGGEAKVEDFVNRSNRWSFRVEVDKNATVVVPVFDFPNWTVFANSEKISHSNKNVLGRIQINLEGGEYSIEGKFMNSRIRTFANITTLIGLIVLIWLGMYGKSSKLFE